MEGSPRPLRGHSVGVPGALGTCPAIHWHPRFSGSSFPRLSFYPFGLEGDWRGPRMFKERQAPTTGWNKPLYRAVSIREPVRAEIHR